MLWQERKLDTHAPKLYSVAELKTLCKAERVKTPLQLCKKVAQAISRFIGQLLFPIGPGLFG